MTTQISHMPPKRSKKPKKTASNASASGAEKKSTLLEYSGSDFEAGSQAASSMTSSNVVHERQPSPRAALAATTGISAETAIPSPSKDDRVLDASAASPFLSPSGVAAAGAAAQSTPHLTELAFSPITERGVVSPTIPVSHTGSPKGVSPRPVQATPKIAVLPQGSAKTSPKGSSPKASPKTSPKASPKASPNASPKASPGAAKPAGSPKSQTGGSPKNSPKGSQSQTSAKTSPSAAKPEGSPKSSPSAVKPEGSPKASPKASPQASPKTSPGAVKPEGSPKTIPKTSPKASPKASPSGSRIVSPTAPSQLQSPSKDVTAIHQSPLPTVEVSELPVAASEAALSVRSVKPDDDLLRQSVDLTVGTGYPSLPSGRPSPVASAHAAIGKSADGNVTVTVDAEPFEASPSRTDRSGSIPVSATSPMAAYPQSPAPAKGPTIVTLVGSDSKPASPAKSLLTLSPAAAKTPSSTAPKPVALTPAALVTPPAGSPIPTAVAEAPRSGVASFVTGSVALEAGVSTIAPTSPARHVEPVYLSPSRATALDSATLQASGEHWQSATEGPISLAAHSIDVRGDSKMVFYPLSFEEAMVALSGTTGKSWTAQAGAKPAAAAPQAKNGGISKLMSVLSCTACGLFGSGSEKLAVELEQDKEVQTILFNTPFNAGVDIHRQILLTVYAFFTGEARADLPMVGEHWTKIGFQSTDPAVELNRAGGIFNLVCLLFLISEFRVDARILFVESTQFPFAATSVAMSGIAVANVSAKGRLNGVSNAQRQFIPTTCRLYVGLFRQFAALWKDSKFSPAEFERVKKTVLKMVESEEGLKAALDLAPAPAAVTTTAAK